MVCQALRLQGLGRFRSRARQQFNHHRDICMSSAAEAVAAKPTFGICRNGAASQTSQSSADWLRDAPRGAYTTARTVNRTKVFDLTFHINRLAESAALMGKSDNCNAPSALTNVETLRPMVIDSMNSAIHAFEQASEAHDGEIKLTLLSHWQDGQPCLETHASPMPGRPRAPVKVQVKGMPRQNAQAKDSEWVRDRAILEKDKPADVNEILLSEPDGRILEGMTSNFFAVIDGELWTAGEGILLGTVRDVLLQQCKEHGITVRLQAPSVEDMARWDGCIISSTSRLALPVDELQLWDGVQYQIRSYSREGLITDIDTWVTSAIESASEAL
eukprot:jgi/Ulvmu1/1498/UM011_0228.1